VFSTSEQQTSSRIQAAKTSLSSAPRCWRFSAFLFALVAATACSDAPLAPNEKIDAIDVERLRPSVEDAFGRLAPQLDNGGIRDRVSYDLGQLRIALDEADARKVRFHTVLVADVLHEYVDGPGGIGNDAADVDAIRLMLRAVSQVVRAGVQLSPSGA
jgi:hypothetical protein